MRRAHACDRLNRKRASAKVPDRVQQAEGRNQVVTTCERTKHLHLSNYAWLLQYTGDAELNSNRDGGGGGAREAALSVVFVGLLKHAALASRRANGNRHAL